MPYLGAQNSTETNVQKGIKGNIARIKIKWTVNMNVKSTFYTHLHNPVCLQ